MKNSLSSQPRLWGALTLSLLTMAPLPFVLAAPGNSTVSNVTSQVKAQLQAFKVVLQKDGDEKLASADVANPGDVIEYQATYSNDGQRAATNLNATLPIPAALSYVPNTATPSGFLASTDDKTFAPAPLQRKVKDANGKTVTVMVPFSAMLATASSIQKNWLLARSPRFPRSLPRELSRSSLWSLAPRTSSHRAPLTPPR